jgi:hypothetical protein
MRGLPADVDAGDPDAVGEARWRARENQAQHYRSEGGNRREDRGSLPEHAALSARARPPAPPRPDQRVFAPRGQGREV